MPDVDFTNVPIGQLSESPASPRVDMEQFRGIKIVMPSRLHTGQKGPVPICGTWVLPTELLWRIKNVPDSLVYLMRNVETHASATGHFRFHEEEVAPEPRGPFVPDEEDPDAQAMGWFHMDLVQTWKVPTVPGKYRIHLVLANVQSNEVEFEVVEPE